MNALTRIAPLLACCLVAAPALATFPQVPIDCALFDIEDPNFLGDHFGFGTELSYSDFGSTDPPTTTGFKGFAASPQQVAQIPDFAPNTDLPVGGHDLDDLPGDMSIPFDQGNIWQSISGEGDFTQGFSRVTLNERKVIKGQQSAGGQSELFAEGKGYAPFQIASDGEGPVPVRVTVDLFSFYDISGGASLSEFLAAALIDATDPANPIVMDQVAGFYFAENNGQDIFVDFTRGDSGEGDDISDSFFTGPSGPNPEDPHFASFFYSFDTTLDPLGTYGAGLFGNAGGGLNGDSWLDYNSSNTLKLSIEVLSDDARLVLPGFAVPEPASALLLGLTCLVPLRTQGGRE